MADPRIAPPPFNVPPFDKDGKFTLPWQLWFLRATTVIASGSAPADSRFLVATADPLLTNEVNLGLLVSGYLKIIVAAGIAAVSSHATVPTNELSGTLQAAQEPAHTGDVTNAAGSLALALVNIPAISGAALTGLTIAQIAGLSAALALLAPLASPALTGNPTAPTAAPADADTSIATTAFVAAATRTLVAPVTLKGYTVAGLPVGIQGDLAFCTNLLLPAFLAVAVGGGAVVGPVFFDGTNWVTI